MLPFCAVYPWFFFVQFALVGIYHNTLLAFVPKFLRNHESFAQYFCPSIIVVSCLFNQRYHEKLHAIISSQTN
jgi:hypothetical protein